MTSLRIQIPEDDAVLFDRKQSWKNFLRWLTELREICREHLTADEAAAVASCKSHWDIGLLFGEKGQTTMAKWHAANLLFRLYLLDLAFEEKSHVGTAVSIADAAEIIRQWIEYSSRRDKETAARLIDAQERRNYPLSQQGEFNRITAENFWRPWQSQFRELVDKGKPVPAARKLVGDEITASGTWPKSSGPSERTLRDRLK